MFFLPSFLPKIKTLSNKQEILGNWDLRFREALRCIASFDNEMDEMDIESQVFK